MHIEGRETETVIYLAVEQNQHSLSETWTPNNSLHEEILTISDILHCSGECEALMSSQ